MRYRNIYIEKSSWNISRLKLQQTCRLSRSQSTISLSLTWHSNEFPQILIIGQHFWRTKSKVWVPSVQWSDTIFSTTSLRAWSVARAPLMPLLFTIWTRSTPENCHFEWFKKGCARFSPILWSLTNPLSSLGKSSDCAERRSNRRRWPPVNLCFPLIKN